MAVPPNPPPKPSGENSVPASATKDHQAHLFAPVVPLLVAGLIFINRHAHILPGGFQHSSPSAIISFSAPAGRLAHERQSNTTLERGAQREFRISRVVHAAHHTGGLQSHDRRWACQPNDQTGWNMSGPFTHWCLVDSYIVCESYITHQTHGLPGLPAKMNGSLLQYTALFTTQPRHSL